jgi:hypothetical protein
MSLVEKVLIAWGLISLAGLAIAWVLSWTS